MALKLESDYIRVGETLAPLIIEHRRRSYRLTTIYYHWSTYRYIDNRYDLHNMKMACLGFEK